MADKVLDPKDELVAAAVTANHARRLCRSGARLRYVTIDGSGHATSAKDSAATTFDVDRRSLRGPKRAE